MWVLAAAWLVWVGASGAAQRIVGGGDANISQVPWQASLQVYGSHTCGAVLLSNTAVLTAAHCIVTDVSFIAVRAGSSRHDLNGVVQKVDEYFIHPGYTNRSDYDNDIAVLRLQNPLSFSSSVQPAKLAAAGTTPQPQAMATVSGWGATYEGGGIVDFLQSVDVPIVSFDECKRIYTTDVTDSMLCAGFMEGGKDACVGDSGGPLTVNGVLVGIVSTGLGCGDANHPGIYSAIGPLRTWIKDASGV